jgi:hypothetical protein
MLSNPIIVTEMTIGQALSNKPSQRTGFETLMLPDVVLLIAGKYP